MPVTLGFWKFLQTACFELFQLKTQKVIFQALYTRYTCYFDGRVRKH